MNKDNDWADCLTVAQLKKIWEPKSEGQELEPGRPEVPRRARSSCSGRAPTRARSTSSPTRSTARKAPAAPTTPPTEDDNVTVQGVAGAKGGLGYFGFSYYEENQDKLKVLEVDSGDGCVAPSVEDGPGRHLHAAGRPLFIYPKAEALKRPEVLAFVEYYVENNATSRRAGAVRPAERRAGDRACKGAPGEAQVAAAGAVSVATIDRRRRPGRGTAVPRRSLGPVAAALRRAGHRRAPAVRRRLGVGRARPSASSSRSSSRRSSSSARSASSTSSPAPTGRRCSPTHSFGVLPLVAGTLMVTVDRAWSWPSRSASAAAIYLSRVRQAALAPGAQAGARGARRHPHRRLRLLRPDARHPALRSHLAGRRRPGVQRALGRPGHGHHDHPDRRLAVRGRDERRARAACATAPTRWAAPGCRSRSASSSRPPCRASSPLRARRLPGARRDDDRADRRRRPAQPGRSTRWRHADDDRLHRRSRHRRPAHRLHRLQDDLRGRLAAVRRRRSR